MEILKRFGGDKSGDEIFLFQALRGLRRLRRRLENDRLRVTVANRNFINPLATVGAYRRLEILRL